MTKIMDPRWRDVSWPDALSRATLETARILDRALEGRELDFAHGLALATVKGSDLLALIKVANEMRQRKVGELFLSQNDVLLMQGEAVLGLEAAGRGLVQPGTPVLNLVSGVFGKVDCVPKDDGNECTEDVCNMLGATSHVARAANVACAQDGGAVCDGKGNCVQCTGDAHCGANHFCDVDQLVCVDLCVDGEQDGVETDLDCGGGTCSPCADGLLCNSGSDCQSTNCVDDGTGVLKCQPQ